jgi:(R,R)-butanediol dehydrogenase/meso-butanediol dehydrogenase/diacetyl reductase
VRGLVTDVGKKGIRLTEFPDPHPGPEQVLIQIKAAGLCGSDLRLYRGMKRPEESEAGQHIIGHEAAGVVEAVGHGVRTVAVGDRVSVYHLMGCGSCFYCRQELYQFCQTGRKWMGFHAHGGDADLLCCDAVYVVPMPRSLSFIDGAVAACAGGTAFCALNKGGVAEGTTVVVFGLGPVGLSVVLLARAMGASVIGLDLVELRLDLARKIGCEPVIDVQVAEPVAAIRELTEGLGAPVVVECSGSPEAQQAAVQVAAIRGRVILVGHNRTRQLTIDPSAQLIVRREVSLIGSWIFSCSDLVNLLSFMDRHQVSFEPIVTHRFPLEKGVEAFALFDTGQTGKVVLVPASDALPI